MSPSKIPPQIVRLLILTAFIVGTYALARHLFVPSSFGRFGHYRGDALQEIAAREPRYAGQKSCDECHSDVRQKMVKYPHKTIACETCHGISKAHGADPDHAPVPAKHDDSLCLRCHDYNVGRPAWMKQIELSKHFSGKGKCAECHIPHQPTEVP